MGPIAWFLFVYVLGGVTLIPLLLGLFLLYAFQTLPTKSDHELPPTDDPANLKLSTDDTNDLKTATDTLAEQFYRKHESDVAAGYFAVCREYVPGGVNGKPPERRTPAGEVVATESPSVYQSMYRSLFDRQQKSTIEPSKSNGRNVKRANNVFFVVLRHGHLMLYDDTEQLEVRYVISLEHHEVSIYNGGGDIIPEGELWIKRNAIRLSRRPITFGIAASSLPFYLFSENISEKEDFYFALLRNQEKNSSPGENFPSPQAFEVRHIISLVQKLHSSEEHLQTRWLNALVGRLFLAMYKTPEMEEFVRRRLTKKISRVKKPNFITRISLQKIQTGEGGPFITNPRLKDLTVDGDCMVEADVKYSGNFRIEIAATARIDLGKRLGAREVELVLAVVCNKLEGRVLLKIKPPPSNRLWFTFETMPKIDLTIEPIVSSRQITYNVILRAIESRIREVIAETIVLPFVDSFFASHVYPEMLTKFSSWDDIAFLDTGHERFRGGIWKKEVVVARPENIPDEDAEDEAEAGGEGTENSIEALKTKEARTISTPALVSVENVVKARAAKRSSIKSLADIGLSSSFEKPTRPDPPRAMRSTSFAAAADPMVTADHADGDHVRSDPDPVRRRDEASAILKDLSSKPMTASPSESPPSSPLHETSISLPSTDHNTATSANTSRESLHTTHASHRSSVVSIQSLNQTSGPGTPTSASFDSRPHSVNEESKHPKTFASAARSLTSTDRKQALAAVNAATAAAQKWGWGVLNRNKQKEAEAANTERVLDAPVGRGRPLPPPGVPLPPPERSSTKNNLFSVPKRRPVPPPMLPKRPDANMNGLDSDVSRPLSKPALPERRNRHSSFQGDGELRDEVLIVEAPVESAPTSPALNEHHDDFFGHGEPECLPAATEQAMDREGEATAPPATDDAEHKEQVSTEQ